MVEKVQGENKMAYNKTLKNGMKGSNGGESRTEKTEVLKKESKKTRRVQNKKVIKEQFDN